VTSVVLFPKLKKYLKGRKFADDEDVICASSGWRDDKWQRFSYKEIRALEKRWNKCTSVAGDCVEK